MPGAHSPLPSASVVVPDAPCFIIGDEARTALRDAGAPMDDERFAAVVDVVERIAERFAAKVLGKVVRAMDAERAAVADRLDDLRQRLVYDPVAQPPDLRGFEFSKRLNLAATALRAGTLAGHLTDEGRQAVLTCLHSALLDTFINSDSVSARNRALVRDFARALTAQLPEDEAAEEASQCPRG